MTSVPLLRALLPPVCPVCGAAGAAPCASCWRRLRPAPVGPVPAGLDACRSLLAYEDEGRELLARLKYRNARGTVAWLAHGMAALVGRSRLGPAVGVVTWAPTTTFRRRARGYDQAQLLAAAVAGELGRPCRRLLGRAPGPPQTGRSREERQRGPTFSARAGPSWLPPPPRATILLVDDLLTTGATLSAAAAALRAAGATSIVAVTAGRTPRRAPALAPDPPGGERTALKVARPNADL